MKIKMLKKEDAVMVLVDIQERLHPAMNESERELLIERNQVLIKGCKVLGLPIIVTQQYTKGLGPTVQPLQDVLGKCGQKTSFSAMGEPSFRAKLEGLNRKTVILSGIETHVCVMQTALDLLNNGYDVFLPMDCVSSRNLLDKKFATKRMAAAGVQLATCESVLFELCLGAKEPGFKEISALVK